MDLITKRQVIGNASVAFGYRMEIATAVIVVENLTGRRKYFATCAIKCV